MELSVIICTYNRSKGLKKTLQSFHSQELPEDFPWEIVVVDNNSTDDTPETVTEFAENSQLVVRYIKEKCQGLSHARNRGVIEANGKYINSSGVTALAEGYTSGANIKCHAG